MTYPKIHQALMKLSDPVRAAHSMSYFKTGPGEYGHGDRFVGLSVPKVRTLAREFEEIPLSSLTKLISSKIHEERLLALFIVRIQYEQADKPQNKKKTTSLSQRELFHFLLRHQKYLNNWDLVDSIVPYVHGHYLFSNPSERKRMLVLAKSKSLWERRIAVLSTSYFIRQNDPKPILKLAKLLLNDQEDLIHKAVGWMLREMGKRSEQSLRQFLDQWAAKMPRTMLRYSLEKFSERDRKIYLNQI